VNIHVQKIQHIATGGNGEVFLGVYETNAGLKRLCAIKQLKDTAANQTEISQFRNEAEICKYFAHQNIVQLYEYATVDNSPAMLIEFVMGRSLNWVCSKIFGSGIMMAPSMIAWIAKEAAAALDYVHNLRHPLTGVPFRVVHRDVTPSNLLVSFTGDVKLADFGIYKGVNRGDETKVGLVKGTISYVSPEQIRGEPATPRSDLYSLGVVMWQLLAGRKLFDRETDMTTIMMKTAAGEIPRDVREIYADANRSLASMTSRLLSLDPNARYESAHTLRQHLEQLLTSEFSRFSRDKLGFFVESLDEADAKQLRNLAMDALQKDLGEMKPESRATSAPDDGGASSSHAHTENHFNAPPPDDRPVVAGLDSASPLRKGKELELTRRDAIVGAKIASRVTNSSSGMQIAHIPQRLATRSSVPIPQNARSKSSLLLILLIVTVCAGLYLLWRNGLLG
jgi:serine/threonine protein kinase